MDSAKNPFSPGAGAAPPELVGRDPILKEALTLLSRIQNRRPEKSMLLTGLRGVGKTVLLVEIEHRAKQKGYRTVFIEAHEGKSLAALLVPHLWKLLFELDRVAGVGNKVKRGFAVLRSFVSGLSVALKDVTIGLDIAPERGAADSGDLEIDLPNVLVALGEAAEDRKSAVAIFIDELQYLSTKELGALIMAMHRVQQQKLPIVLIGAGLPLLLGLAGESKSYAERLFNYPDVGALTESETAKALNDPAKAEGVTFDRDALKEIYRLTKGYPYFLQEWGYQAWNQALASPISLEVVRHATENVIERLDKNFFRVRFDRLIPSEKKFLRAMAELGPDHCKMGDIAELLKLKVTSLAPLRAKLIKKGMIYSPAYGELAFTVPLFDEFMRRAMEHLNA